MVGILKFWNLIFCCCGEVLDVPDDSTDRKEPTRVPYKLFSTTLFAFSHNETTFIGVFSQRTKPRICSGFSMEIRAGFTLVMCVNRVENTQKRTENFRKT